MAVYDSAKTRAAAKALNRLYDALNADVKPNLRRAKAQQDEFRGEAAGVMQEAIESADRRLIRIIDRLEVLQHQVNAYADAMERVDQKLADSL